MSADPILSEIEAQMEVAAASLAVASRALANVRAFTARVNQGQETKDVPRDTDGDAAFPSYDDLPPTGGRNNGRKKAHHGR